MGGKARRQEANASAKMAPAILKIPTLPKRLNISTTLIFPTFSLAPSLEDELRWETTKKWWQHRGPEALWLLSPNLDAMRHTRNQP